MVGQKEIDMARKTAVLNARKVERLTKIGRHADGANLYLPFLPMAAGAGYSLSV
jgi:hypothetical protein